MEIFSGEETKIIREVMPVILRDKKTTWKLILIDEDKLFIKWSVCEELIDVGINAIDEYKIRTKDGKHKKSASFRNVYKYCAPIDSWYMEGTSCIFRTNEICIGKDTIIYDIIVRSSNCENNQFEFVIILNLAVSQGYNISAKYYTTNDFLRAIVTENANNVRFTTYLFLKS